jgi:formylglycine-generating enzyme required for sulfatase activity
MVRVEGGTYRLGSDSTERELGYRGSPDVVRDYSWYDAWEADPHAVELASFAIDRTPVTQLEYAAFVTATDRPLPDIDSTAYHAQGFLVHPWSEVKPFRWNGGHPPDGIGDHPIVLVDYEDAAAYCAWRGEREGQATRLPTGRRLAASTICSGTCSSGRRRGCRCPSRMSRSSGGAVGTTPRARAGAPSVTADRRDRVIS